MTTELFGVSAGQQMATMDQAKVDSEAATQMIHAANANHLIAQDRQQELIMKMLAEPDQPITQAPQAPPPGSPGEAMQAAAQGNTSPAQALADNFIKQGLKLSRAGFTTQAEALGKAAAVMVKDAQETLTSAQQGAYRAAQAKEITLREINALAAGVTDETSFNQAKMLWMGNHPGQPIPPALQAYNPATIAAIRNGTAQGLAKLKQEAEAANKESQEKLREARVKFMEDREKILEETARVKKELADKKAKEGKDVGAPTPIERDMALRAIEAEYADANLPAREKLQAADDIASRARLIRKTNAGIDAATAISQALEAAKPDFQPIAEAYKVFGIDMPFSGKRMGYKKSAPKPANAETPIPLVEAPKRTIGQTYILKNGKHGTWTGQGFELVGGP